MFIVLVLGARYPAPDKDEGKREDRWNAGLSAQANGKQAEVNMQRKSRPKNTDAGRIIDPEVLKLAREGVFRPIPAATFPCKICAEEGATEQSDGLCWVCRRLKISAWREIEQQIPLSE